MEVPAYRLDPLRRRLGQLRWVQGKGRDKDRGRGSSWVEDWMIFWVECHHRCVSPKLWKAKEVGVGARPPLYPQRRIRIYS